MYYTPEEAEKKVCPFKINSLTKGYCITDSCMAWRLELLVDFDNDDEDIYLTRGYCGLGGRP